MTRMTAPQVHSVTDVGMWRERILDVAEEHFRHIGFQKTTVADIVKPFGMSSANIYRFFPSRMAINASVCGRFLDSYIRAATSTAHIPGSARWKPVETLTQLHELR